MFRTALHKLDRKEWVKGDPFARRGIAFSIRVVPQHKKARATRQWEHPPVSVHSTGTSPAQQAGTVAPLPSRPHPVEQILSFRCCAGDFHPARGKKGLQDEVGGG